MQWAKVFGLLLLIVGNICQCLNTDDMLKFLKLLLGNKIAIIQYQVRLLQSLAKGLRIYVINGPSLLTRFQRKFMYM